jgi:hypothetical protein
LEKLVERLHNISSEFKELASLLSIINRQRRAGKPVDERLHTNLVARLESLERNLLSALRIDERVKAEEKMEAARERKSQTFRFVADRARLRISELIKRAGKKKLVVGGPSEGVDIQFTSLDPNKSFQILINPGGDFPIERVSEGSLNFEVYKGNRIVRERKIARDMLPVVFVFGERFTIHLILDA